MSRLWLALDRRLHLSPVLRALRQTLPEGYLSPLDAPPFSLGRLAVFLLALLLLSGLALTLFYEPTPARAAASLAFLHERQPLGWLVHNTHRWSALLLMLVVFLHTLRAWVHQAYRYPRDLNWWLGLGLLLLVIIMGGTGYLLRWDIKAFALMDLIVSTLRDLPAVGGPLLRAMLGAAELEMVPLYRGYAVHIWFLPLLLFLGVLAHLLIVWRQGLTHLPTFRPDRRARLPQRLQNLLPALALLALVLALAFVTPHEGPGEPDSRSPWPQPDWVLTFYLLPFWFFKGPAKWVGAFLIPAAVLLFLAAAPRLPLSRARRWWGPALALIGIVGVVGLLFQMGRMGATIPLQGCTACHRPGILGGAPVERSEFRIQEPEWIVFHLKDPEGSLFIPFEAPLQEP